MKSYRNVEVKVHKLFTSATDGTISLAAGLVLKRGSTG
jgi:hypothetical protein